MADEAIRDMVEPVPEEMLEGKTAKEQAEIARGYRAFTRLRQQESQLSTQAYLQTAPTSQQIAKPHRRIPVKDQHNMVRINIPKALQQLGKKTMTSPSLTATSGLKPKHMSQDELERITKSAPLTTVEIKSDVKSRSPTERIAILYTPTANIRTTGRNEQMRAYKYQTSYRNVELPPPPSQPISEGAKGVFGNDPSLSNFLPLEEFDPGEVCSPQEWIEMGKERGGTPARSRFRSDESAEEAWLPCRVIEYNDQTATYTVVWNHTDKQKYVKRLNVLFDAEDEEVFADRVERAKQMRAEAQGNVRLHLYIESMDESLITPIDEEQVDAILSLVASEFPLAHLHVVERSIAEMRAMYSYGLKKAVHHYMYRNPEEKLRLKALCLPPDPKPQEPSLDQLLGTIDTVSPSFHTSKAYVEENLFQTHALLYGAVHAVHARWAMFEDHLLCDTQMKGVLLPCELGEFDGVQARTGSHVSERLRDDWSVNISATIQNDLDVHFNFYEEKVERFRASRMSRFCRMVNLMMSSQLRQLLVASIKSYTDFLQKYRVVLPEDFDANLDLIDEIDEDREERAFWDARAVEVIEQRKEQLRLIEDAKNAGTTAKPKQAQVDEDGNEVEETEEKGCTLLDRPCFEFEIPPPAQPFSKRIIRMTREPNGLEPLFVIKLQSNGDSVMFLPLLEEVEDKVKGVMDNFFSFTEDLKGVGEQLFPLLGLPPFYLKPLEHQEKVVLDAKEIHHRVLVENMQGPRQLQQLYQSFEYILKIETEQMVYDFAHRDPAPTQHDYNNVLERLFRDMDRIQNRTLNEVKFELIKVECDQIKGALLRKATEVAQALMDLLASQLKEDTIQTATKYEEIHQHIGIEPKTPEELQAHKQYVDGVEAEMQVLWSVFQRISNGYDLLFKYKHFVDSSDFENYWHAFEWPKKVNQVLEDSEFKYKEYRNAFQVELTANCEKLMDDITALSSQVEGLSRFSDEAKSEDYYEYVKQLEDHIKKYQADISLFNSREALFGLPTTQYSHIKEIKQMFDPYYQLWEITYNFNTQEPAWRDNQFNKLDADSVEQNVNDWSRKLNALTKKLKEDGPLQVSASLKAKIDAFKPYLPLIKALRNNGMRQAHWKQIGTLVGWDSVVTEGLTLQTILNKGLNNYISEIEEISETASKTAQLEHRLENMQNDWKKIQFDIEPYGETYKLKASEEVQLMLDDHIMKTQSILGSPYIRNAPNLEKSVKDWERQLNNIQSVMDEWFKCQSTWAYLEPIFSSSDISKSMPTEANKFTNVDSNWKHIMESTRTNSHVQQKCQEEKLLDKFVEANQTLDEILKKLHQFLETKRMAFPRFYFISNEELLQILSDSKDPYLVQPYLGKCFEGIKRIKFEESLDITGMESAEGEKVSFVKKVNPADHNNAVEAWLLQVETVMCDSIRDHIKRAIVDYKSRDRVDFIRAWPGQVVIAVCTIFWTKEAEDSLMVSSGGKTGLEEYAAVCKKQLEDLVLLVRDRGLSEVQRCTLEALVVIEVHAKEIIEELSQKGINDPNSFDWLAQLRYYWEDDDLRVKQINAELGYGYEYLGNTGRLVITQLTDRCYRTLMGALHLHYGGAPEGPAGTGKTETTKDLGKALAKQCVVYNCSDQITYKDMAKLFKGLAQSGAWGCFDEFNRIEVQVLSVIAQQVATIQDAIGQKRTEFLFDGVMIKLKMGSAVFITMNPGYAGRAELPDNLKALFRPVAMMVPNYAMIAEIQLYSYGFLHGKPLSTKIVATYRLCSEQLSSQDHYDYGMRAVKAVLTQAGRLKRKYPDEDEQIIMLRSIQDVNLPKFLHQDVALFNGIIADLFPNVKLPAPDYDVMTRALEQVCQQQNLQPTEYFLLKCFQTYEMIVVRHGMMVVGFSYGGKTKCLLCLSKALGLMSQQQLEEKTRMTHINPKSITMGQLYGKMDQSGEWNDGVLANAFRTASSDNNHDRKWLVLDGPVDALWIENMNTVLDDNKKLCLQNGDIIPMSKQMNMIFEVQDLQSASPATVSRCGMVYVEPETLGWQPLVQSWLNKIPEFIRDSEPFMAVLKVLLDTIVEPCLEFVRKRCTTAIPQGNSVAVASLLKLFGHYLQEFDFSNAKPKEFDERDVIVKLEGYFIFSVVWTIGGCLYLKDRIAFNTFLTELCTTGGKDKQMKLSVPLPDRRSLYDCMFVFDKEAHFQDWLDNIGDFKVPEGAQYHEIIVPTTDTERYTYLMKLFIEDRMPCLLVGDTGTGKTIMAKSLIKTGLDNELYVPATFLQFSAQTTANQTQDLIESKVERRRKGQYGPPINRRMVIMVDDLNMPMQETYGAQPPVELLRQWMDYRGWYNHTKDNVDFRELVDVQFVGAMGPPGGGRNHVTPRFTRHFNTIAVPAFDDSTLKKIFGCLMDWIIQRGYPATFRALGNSIVAATVDVYQTLVEKLKPTPEKSHYTFNLRDVSKVFQGIAMAAAQKIQDPQKMYRLWVHEVNRAFADRFIVVDDNIWFTGVLNDIMTSQFKVGYQSIVPQEPIIFTDFATDARLYEEVTDMDEARKSLEDQLEYYNQNQRQGQMELVIFNYVIEHVSRISRILKQPFGNALLIGVGGSGRTSCTKLATKINDYEYFTVAMSKEYRRFDFLEDCKKVLLKCGKDGIPTTFNLNDTQIAEESFLEDVCNLLNTGEIPNLITPEDMELITTALKPHAKEQARDMSRDGITAFFVERCRLYLHVVLSFSPVGKTLRDRLRKFPSLVNCTTIDWFREWPEEGLRGVARNFLSEVDLTDDMRLAVSDCFVEFQTSVRSLGELYLAEARQQTYVTPTSYLELLSTFKQLLSKKKNELAQQKNRYDNGLEQLKKTEEDVELMTQELEVMKPQLKRKAKESEELIVVISQESEEAEKIRAKVSVEEQAANRTAAKAKGIKDECEAKLAEAEPKLLEAQDAVKKLDNAELRELKSLQKPPEKVKYVMEAVSVMLGKSATRKVEQGKVMWDWWETARKEVMTDKFKDTLLTFDVDGLAESTVENIQKYINNKEFDAKVIAKTSQACVGIVKWVVATESYYQINKIVKPKKADLAQAEKEFKDAMEALSFKKEELAQIDAQLNAKRSNLERVKKEKQDLTERVADTDAKLKRAVKLIDGLGDEKSRYVLESERLTVDFNNVLGDVVISSGMVSYLGAFQNKYRQQVVAEWMELCQRKSIPGTRPFVMEKFLGSPVDIQQWKAKEGLPTDSFSTDNAIMMKNARRWPLLIDPQQQANKWIRRHEAAEKLLVVRPTEPNYAASIANAVRVGQPVLLENVEEDLDPVLENLLLKRLVKEGVGYTITIGEPVEYNDNFRFYMTTKLPRPHYRPEVSTKVALINFMITQSGLQDQLLQEVVLSEKREVEMKKREMTVEAAKNKAELKRTEDRILSLLSREGNLLDDESAIQELDKSKQQSDKNTLRQQEIDAIEKQSDKTRAMFVPVAHLGAILFFCVTELANIDPMYQYSLQFYMMLFQNSLAESEKGEDVQERINNIMAYFQYALYTRICRSLFSKDQLLFSFIMALKIQEVDLMEVRWLLTGGIDQDKGLSANPCKDWLPDINWKLVWRASAQLPSFSKLEKTFVQHQEVWKALYQSPDPATFEFPPELNYNDIRKLIVIRCLRGDKLVTAVSEYVRLKMSEKYIEAPLFKLEDVANELASDPSVPIIFVLSPGADPMVELERVAEIKGMKGKRLMKLSLGQGQDKPARQYIDDGKRLGNWVMLQNCHLFSDFMPTLARVIEDYSRDDVKESLHREYRLWLTSMPSESFPVSVLQNGAKLVQEPPKGLKSNLLRSYMSDPIVDEKFFNAANKPNEWRKLLFGLAFFHSLVQERRKYGPLGWNIPYEFNDTDMRISVRQLQAFINENEQIPYEALIYLTGQCNYGGRVTDEWDRRSLLATLKVFYTDKILEDGYKFSEAAQEYYAPTSGEHETYVEYIRHLPLGQNPAVFGLHPNADITKDEREARLLMEATLATQPRESGGGKGATMDPKTVVFNLAKDVHAKLPKKFDIEAVSAKYPIIYNQSMNTVLRQELIRYNRLLLIILNSLDQLQKAIKGEVVMSADLDQVFNAMYDGHIPQLWKARSYPSLKPFGAYVNDLLARLNFLQQWVDEGPPPVFWISGFFFTQSFLTGVVQNCARKYQIAIDKLVWNLTVMHESDYATPPEDGCYINGLYLEGAGWDHTRKLLCESQPKELFLKFPIIYLQPVQQDQVSKEPTYACPAYKTTERRGVLSTTGHSTNFIMALNIPRDDAVHDESHWVRRGVALFTQLEY